MATTMKRLPARTTATLRATIDQAGSVSAATRALLWLGAGAAGLPISPAGRREIAALLGEESLAPDVVTALQQLYDHLGNRRAASNLSAHPLDATTCVSGALHAPPAVLVAVATVERLETKPSGALSHETEDMGDPFANVGMEFAG